MRGVATVNAFKGWLTFLLVLVSLTGAQEVQLERDVFDIAAKLRCPTCISSSVADSDAPVSVEMRTLIQEQLQEGKGEAEILASFQERYGDWILLNPPRRGVYLLVWGLPVIAGLAGLVGLALFLKRWTKRAEAPVEVSDEDLSRVRRELGEV